MIKVPMISLIIPFGVVAGVFIGDCIFLSNGLEKSFEHSFFTFWGVFITVFSISVMGDFEG